MCAKKKTNIFKSKPTWSFFVFSFWAHAILPKSHYFIIGFSPRKVPFEQHHFYTMKLFENVLIPSEIYYFTILLFYPSFYFPRKFYLSNLSTKWNIFSTTRFEVLWPHIKFYCWNFHPNGLFLFSLMTRFYYRIFKSWIFVVWHFVFPLISISFLSNLYWWHFNDSPKFQQFGNSQQRNKNVPLVCIWKLILSKRNTN